MNDSPAGFARDDSGRGTLGGRPLDQLLAEANVSTPAYFYDLSGISSRTQSIVDAFGDAPHLVAYAMKANSAASVVRTICAAGAGIDAVSGGELLLARRLGVAPRRIVLSGVAKTDGEMELALREDILAIQVESPTELSRIAARAHAANTTARVSLRINPAVEIDSHSHIATGHDRAKFGIAQRNLEEVFSLLAARPDVLQLVGISTHVGSMLRKPDSYLDSAKVVCTVAQEARQRGHALEYVDFGGGFGIDYGGTEAAPPAEFAQQAVRLLKQRDLDDLMLVVEPGRSLVGPFGVLLASVVQTKESGERRWIMIDAGMNDLLRPALYQARHRIEPLEHPARELEHRVVGPVCESTDDFGDYALGPAPRHVVIRDAGAYAFTMASEYNGRPLPAEVFVKDGRVEHVSPSPGVSDWVERRARA